MLKHKKTCLLETIFAFFIFPLVFISPASAMYSFAQTSGQILPEITEGTSVSVTMSINDSPIPFNLTLHATDLNSDTLTWSISSPASHGTAVASVTGNSKSENYAHFQSNGWHDWGEATSSFVCEWETSAPITGLVATVGSQ